MTATPAASIPDAPAEPPPVVARGDDDDWWDEDDRWEEEHERAERDHREDDEHDDHEALHVLTFATFALALYHGVFAGTDTALPWMRWMYIGGFWSVFSLTLYRVFAAPETRPRPRPA